MAMLRAAFNLTELCLLATVECTGAACVLFESLGSSNRRLVMDGSDVVRLVHGHCRVDNLRDNSMLLNDWLNVLVDVMMNTLSRDDGSRGGVMGRIMGRGGVLVLGSITVKILLMLPLVSVVDSSVLNWCSSVGVLLGPGTN